MAVSVTGPREVNGLGGPVIPGMEWQQDYETATPTKDKQQLNGYN